MNLSHYKWDIVHNSITKRSMDMIKKILKNHHKLKPTPKQLCMILIET